MYLKTLPKSKIRHRSPLFAFVLFVIMIYASCKEAPGLHVGKDGIVLRSADGSTQKAAGDGKLFWLHAVKGQPQLEGLEKLSARDLPRFKSFQRAVPLEDASYEFSFEQDIFILKGAKAVMEANGRYGFLFVIEGDKVLASWSTKKDCEKEMIEVTNGGILRQGANEGNFLSWSSNSIVDEDGVAMIERLIYSQARTAVGDTGTEIVIVDNFAPASGPDCCKETNLVCDQGAESGENVGADPIDIAGYVENFKLQVGHACVYEYCYYLVVADQITGEIRCYNTLLCDVRLQLWNDGTFSIMVEAGCDTAAAVTICPGP